MLKLITMGDSSKMGLCGLCSQWRKLLKSHIIPEYAYVAAYDEKHRLVLVDPCNPENTGTAQKGIRSRILCIDCEQLLNDRYEKPFLKYWNDHDVINSLALKPLTILSGIDYTLFKLFHLSILLRASRSDHPNFSEVDLGPHEDRLRQMLLENDPGPVWQYLIVCTGIMGEDGRLWYELVGPAHRMRYPGYWAYYFVFMGCQWFYFVGSHPLKELESIALSPDGRLPVAIKPYKAITHYQELRGQRRAK